MREQIIKSLTVLGYALAASMVILACSMPIIGYLEKIEEAKSKVMIELISKGVDPIAARCSVSTAEDSICILYISTKEKGNKK